MSYTSIQIINTIKSKSQQNLQKNEGSHVDLMRLEDSRMKKDRFIIYLKSDCYIHLLLDRGSRVNRFKTPAILQFSALQTLARVKKITRGFLRSHAIGGDLFNSATPPSCLDNYVVRSDFRIPFFLRVAAVC